MMDIETIEALAKQAGFVVTVDEDLPRPHITVTHQMDGNCGDQLMRFATLVEAAERGACAVACDEHDSLHGDAYAAVCRDRAPMDVRPDSKEIQRMVLADNERPCVYGVAGPCQHPNCLEAHFQTLWAEQARSLAAGK